MWYHVSLSTEVMLAISQQIPFVEQQRAATVAAELAEQQPQAKRQQETRPPHCEEPQQGEGGRGGVNLFDHALQAQQRQEEQPQAPQQPQQPQQPQPPGEEEFKMRNPSVAQVKPEPGPKAAARNPRLGLQIADLGKKNPKAKPERVCPLVKPQAPTRARAAAGVGAGAAAAAGAVARSERRRRRRARQKAAGAAKEAPPPLPARAA